MANKEGEIIAKVSDFGSALFVGMPEDTLFKRPNYPLIAAPERLQGVLFTEKCDVFRYCTAHFIHVLSFSMILWELYTLQTLTLDVNIQPQSHLKCYYVDGPLPIPSHLTVEITNSDLGTWCKQIEAGYRPPLSDPGTWMS